MNDQAIRFRLGVFVLAVLIVLAVLVTLFGGLPNYFKQVDHYTVVFENAEGLSVGAPVRKSGVKVGSVESIKLDPDTGKVRVVIQVEKDFVLRKSDRPTLSSGLLSGDTAISILGGAEEAEEPPAPKGKEEPGKGKEEPGKGKEEPGKGKEEPGKVKAEPGKAKDPPPVKKAEAERIEPGAVIRGFSASDTSALLKKTADLIGPAKEAMTEIRNTFKKIDKLTPLMEETLKEYRDVAKATRELIPELRKTTADVGDLARATRDAVPELRKTNDEIRELAKSVRTSVPDFKRTNEEFQLFARTWTKLGERMDLFVQTNEEKLSKSLTRFEETLRRFNDVLSDDNQRNLRDILRNAKVGSDKLESIAKGTEDLIRDSQIAVKRLNESLLKADKVLDNVDKASRPFAEHSEPILRNVEETTDKLNRMLGEVRETFRVLARSDGTLQKLLSDPALYQNLNDTTIMVQKLLPRVDRILHDVEIFSDKIARHPESLGIGGAIRPSTGLKEPATVFPWRHP